jgi:5,10-methylene-tetrahydrofolate dehydrogenase/methenyl tetrahydrofolate cyclohydrolase
VVGNVIDAKALAQTRREELKEAFKAFPDTTLATILTGDDEGSHRYQRSLSASCNEIGINHLRMHPRTKGELETAIHVANGSPDVHGILLFHPVDEALGCDRYELANSVRSGKDVEGLGVMRLGSLAQRYVPGGVYPCTPEAVMELLRATQFEFHGNATILNRSDVVGKPLRIMLEDQGMTVFAAYEKTSKLLVEENLAQSHLVVTAVPEKSYRLPAQTVRSDATVIAVTASNIDEAVLRACKAYCVNVGHLTQNVLFSNQLALRRE